MKRFKLFHQDGIPVYVNPDHIVLFTPAADYPGSTAFLIGHDERRMVVDEDVDRVRRTLEGEGEQAVDSSWRPAEGARAQ